MVDLLDHVETHEMARMVTKWLYRLAQDDDCSEDVCEAAARLIDGAEELRSLIELD